MNTIEDFINNVILSNIKTMVETPGLQYLSFGVISSMIEFLGACLDSKDFFKGGESERRFSRAIHELDAFKEYKIYTTDRSVSGLPVVQYDLYTNLRCGMVHIGKPGRKVAFTEKGDVDDGNKHLEICNFDDGTKRLVIVCEDFFSDLSAAANELLSKIKKDESMRKHTEVFMNPKLKTISCEEETTSITTVSG
jgi:hypothetical protein